MKTVIIAGGAGFIGSHLADDMIRRGYRVIIFDDLSTGERTYVPKDAIFIKGDVREKKEVERVFARYTPSVVFHVAGQASQFNAFQDPSYDIRENFLGTVHMVEASIAHGVSRFLYASSMTVYGAPKHLPVSENEACEPISYYGISKYAAERFVLATAARTDLPNVFIPTVFRMFNVYGPRQSLTNPYQGIMAILMGRIFRNEPVVIYGDGKQSRDFVFVDDVVRIWTQSIARKKTFNQVINIGFGENISLNHLVQELFRIFGKDKRKYPIRYEPARPGEQRHMRADMRKIRACFGSVPRISLAAGLKKTHTWITSQVIQ